MNITNDAILLLVIKNAIDDCLKEILEESYNVLQDEICNAGIPAHSDGLWNAWEKTFGTLCAEISFSPTNLALVQTAFPTGRHGSNMAAVKGGSPPSDVRQGFAELIFEGLAPISPMLGKAGGTQPPKDAWEPFLREVAAKLNSWVITAFKARGFDIS